MVYLSGMAVVDAKIATFSNIITDKKHFDHDTGTYLKPNFVQEKLSFIMEIVELVRISQNTLICTIKIVLMHK